MATQSIPDQPILDNLPPHIQQAITAARAIESQVNGRYLAAVNLIAAGQVSRNPAGGFDVISRTSGQPYHINGASCTCKDAEYNAPTIAGRKACAHQIAAWIVGKAAILATQPAPAPAEVSAPAQPAPELAQPTGLGDLPLADLLAGAAADQEVAYELVTTHMGGHGYVNIMRAIEDPEHHESFLVGGDWKQDRLHVCRWADHFGQPDYYTTRRLAQLRPAVTPSLTIDAGDPRGLAPAVAYYLETTGSGIKVMVTRGEAYPRPVKTFSGPDRLEEARVFARIRAEAQCTGLRQATPAGRFAVTQALLPEGWRQRMGGSQVGRAWVVYAEPAEQSQKVDA